MHKKLDFSGSKFTGPIDAQLDDTRDIFSKAKKKGICLFLNHLTDYDIMYFINLRITFSL